jgi:hypothetical protein
LTKSLYVKVALFTGYCYIQGLHFSYVLQEDSVQNSKQ